MKDTNSKTSTATAARCPICNGTGHIISNGKQTPCTPCAGTGTRPDSAEFDRLLLELDQLEAEAFSAWQRAEQTGSAADWEEANEAAARRDDAAADCYSFNPGEKETKEEAKDIMKQTPQQDLKQALKLLQRTLRNGTLHIYKVPGGRWFVVDNTFEHILGAPTAQELTSKIDAYLSGLREGQRQASEALLDALEKAEAETAAAWAKYRTPEATKEDWEAYEEASLKRNTLRDLYEGKL